VGVTINEDMRNVIASYKAYYNLVLLLQFNSIQNEGITESTYLMIN